MTRKGKHCESGQYLEAATAAQLMTVVTTDPRAASGSGKNGGPSVCKEKEDPEGVNGNVSFTVVILKRFEY